MNESIAEKATPSQNRVETIQNAVEGLHPIDRNNVKVFISHRHEDQEIAKVIVDSFLEWGFTRKRVFCSSEIGGGGTPGSFLTEEIKRFLFECHLVIYIYSTSDKNWEWCSYEIGVAEDPAIATRIVTLAVVEGQEPKIQKGRLIVNVTKKEIHDFVRKLFKEDDFFPGDTAYWPDYDDNALENQAISLFNKLDVICKEKYQQRFDSRPIPRWGWFTLELNGVDLQTCESIWEKDEQDKNQQVCEILKEKLYVVEAAGWGLYHFGFNDSDSVVNMHSNFNQLVEQWRDSIGVGNPTEHCFQELVDEIWRTRKNRGSALSWRPFPSANPHSPNPGFVYPIVTRYYKNPDGGRRYDVHMFLMPESFTST